VAGITAGARGWLEQPYHQECIWSVASFSGRLPLRSLHCICDLWTTWRSGRRPGISSTWSNRKVDLIMMYVDSVLVTTATCPHIK